MPQLTWISMSVLIALCVRPLAVPVASAQESNASKSPTITVLAWNIELGGSELATIQEQLKLEKFDILALSEVPRKAANEVVTRWGSDSFFIGQKGGEGCLLIAWDPQKFDKLDAKELTEFNGQEFAPGIQSAPLMVSLRDKQSQSEFCVVMNHLARGSAELRKRQALILVEWAKQQTLPIIAVGGYNFDYDIPSKKGNEAFDAFLADSTWSWIAPKPMVDTNWSDRNRDGKDDYPDSMLDFVFVAGPAKQWPVQAEVVVRAGDFPDDAKTSDQRPIRTTVTLPKLR